MSKTQRPLSPHLQVYKPQLTSMLSIAHRATGMYLSLGMVLFTYWLYLLTTTTASADAFMQFFQTGFGLILLYSWVFAFAYHLCNGIRHLFWDIGKGYSLPVVYRSGYLVITAAVALTVAIYLLSR